MYSLKIREEVIWALITAVSVYLLEVLVKFDPDAITDWRSWLVAIGAGMVRAGAAALLVALGRGVVHSEPTP